MNYEKAELFTGMFNLKHKEECFLNFNFFFLKECEIEAGKDMSHEQLIERFLNSDLFGKNFTIREFPVENTHEAATYRMHGPFVIESIGINVFKRYRGRQLKKVLFDYSKKAALFTGESAVNNFKQSFQLVEKFKIKEDELFYLNRDWYSSPDKRLEGFISIYDYYLLFIVINQDKNRLLLLDYGAD